MRNIVTDFFGRPDDIAWLLANIDQEQDLFRSCRHRVVLAWYLRQRDTAAALSILDGLDRDGFLAVVEATPDLRGRWHLARVDCLRLLAQVPEALRLLPLAEAAFQEAADLVGLGDCAFAAAELCLTQGDAQGASHLLERAMGLYQEGGDAKRSLVAAGWLAYQQSYLNAKAADARWADALAADKWLGDPAVEAYARTFHGGIAFQYGDFPASIRHWQEAYDHAQAAGAVWLAIILATVTGSAYANLFDLPTALEWKEKAYALAKPMGWPEALGTTLSSMAETTTSLGDHARAGALFEEALPHLERLTNTRRHFIAYSAYGRLCLETGMPERAVEWFEKAGVIARNLGHPDTERLHSSAMTAALLKLNRVGEAEAMIMGTLSQPGFRGNPYYEVEALRSLAAVRRVQDGGDPSRAITILEQAVAKGTSMDGLTIRADIYTELARDYEAAGDYRQALHYERCARASWQRNFDQQNGSRIQALQVRFDTARAKSDAEHHRMLAEAEAARAGELDRANQTLERLGAIGQEITARLDSESVFTTLSRHLHDLMPTSTLFVGLKDEANEFIDIRYRMEDGKRLPSRQVPLASDNLSARCVRDNEEILVAWGERTNPNSVPGTRHMRTVLFRPLTLGDRVLGIVSVQSDKPDAYGPRELLIFRTICAYGAIAMANAEAYQQLDRAVAETREALQRLVQQEKMAALGQLVAGVAHEVNTPLGVTLSAVSQLSDSVRHLRDLIKRGTLTRTVLTETLDNGQELAVLAQRNVVRAADMIRTFKGVAVDHGSDERRIFDLDDYLAEIMSLVRARVTGNGNRLELDVVSVQMDTYPGALAQVITNLVTNVADHAYAPDRPGRILVQARQIDSMVVEIAVQDHGAGIPPDILPKVFDPFFTTRRASGSMGLGLHVAFNQVTQRLNGSIVIDSVPGRGTVAIFRIPREVSGQVPTNFLPIPAGAEMDIKPVR
ncbi:MAG: tetratricopeptide repeat protein [Niveispirillum sp.]|nr:tetratricopeptide repeat protein [Niveispirillum sp.]